MNKNFLVAITVVFIIGMGFIFLDPKRSNQNSIIDTNSVKNVEVKDGVQYITIDAKGGYWPNLSKAQAGIPTKLVVNTDNTYDCSSALSIRDIGYQKILPNSGEELIDLGTPAVGVIQGLCSMGMYQFKINFQ